jgi:transposase
MSARRVTDKDRHRIAELVGLGLSQAEVAQMVGVHARR